MATLGNWSFADLTGNSQFVLVGSVLYAVGNTTIGGQFAIYSSTDYGITTSSIAAYTFPASPPNTEFDPAVVADSSGFLHILGTRHNPAPGGSAPNAVGPDDVVKFTFDTNASTYPAWQASQSYTLGQKIYDVGTSTIQVVTQAGTSGATIPTFSTAAYTATPWSATTAFRLGDTISVTIGFTTYVFKVTVAGISGATVPAWPLTGSVTDGSITWTNIGSPDVTDGGVIWQSQGGALSGPYAIVLGTNQTGQAAVLIGSDYDITTLTTGGTFAVVQIVDNVTFQEIVNSYEISTANQIVATQLITSSPARGGQAYDSVSLVAPNGVGNVVEAYMTSHNKAINFTDITFTLGVYTTPTTGIGAFTWMPQTVLLTLPVRHVDNRLTVIANGNSRWLSDTIYTQNRSGLSGNMLLGYLADITNISAVPWSFKQFAGAPTQSLVESCLNVFTDDSTALGLITRDLTRNPAVDGIISVNTLNVSLWQYTPNPAFRNPVTAASWLRGTKSVLPIIAGWGFIGSQRVTPGVSTFYSGYLVPPVAAITPTAINPAFRNQSYSFDASASFDLNYNTIEYEWNLQISTGVPFPSWQASHVYALGAQILDTNGNVQIAVEAGTSGATQPLAQWEPDTAYTLGQQIVDSNGYTQQVTTAGTSNSTAPFWNTQYLATTGDGFVVWTNEGLALTYWSIDIDAETSDGSVTWATALILVPNFVPNTQNSTATLTIGDVIGPAAQTFQVQVGVIDLDSSNHPIHTPPTGTQLAQSNISLPFVPLTTITWVGNFVSGSQWAPATAYPEAFVIYDGLHMQEVVVAGISAPIFPPVWNDGGGETVDNTVTWQDLGLPVSSPASAYVGRNQTFTLVPTVTPGQVGLPITYTWTQIAGTPVAIGATNNPTLIVLTQGANLNTPLVDGLVFELTVNDGVNVPVTSVVTLNVVPYIFNESDTLFLSRSNWAVLQDYDAEAHTIPNTPGPYLVTVDNPPGPLQNFEDGGVVYNGGGSLTAVLTPPLVGEYNVSPTGQYWFSVADATRAIRVTYSITQAATIAQRNTPQYWPPLDVSGMLTGQSDFKRSTDLEGDDRFIVISPAAILVYGSEIAEPASYLMRKLLVPDSDLGTIEDAVHTEADYTMVLTSTNNLYRYSMAPFVNTDNPDTTLNLDNYVTLTAPTPSAWVAATSYSLGDEVLDTNGNVQLVIQNGVSTTPGPPTWNPTRFGVTNDGPFLLWKNLGPPVIFDAIFSTDTFANSRVIALSGPSGCLLMQLNSSSFAVEGFFEISVESGLIYGADNVQWIRQSNVESLHSGKILLGTLDAFGHTYETLLDLQNRLVLGTWDASKLKNQFVTTGEILFEAQSSYVGLPLAPTITSTVINPNGSVTITWTAERPDLITSYQLRYSIDNGVYNLLTYVGSGIVQTYTTTPLSPGHTYSFEIRSGSADGFSPYSQPVAVYLGTALPPIPAQIIGVTGPSTGPFVANISWVQFNPNVPPVNGYLVQQSVDGGTFLTIATIYSGTTQNLLAGPLAAGHTYSFQIAATYNGIQTGYSNLVSIAFPVGAEVAVPAQALPNGTHGVPYGVPPAAVILTAGVNVLLPNNPSPQFIPYGVVPYTWAVVGGALPPGLSLDPNLGAITGTPTTPGLYGFAVQITDSAMPTKYVSAASPTLSITIS